MRRILARLAAFDPTLFDQSSRRGKNRMAIAGACLVFIYASTLFSVFIFLYQVLHGSLFLTILISAVLAFLVLAILLLVNLTVSNDLDRPRAKLEYRISTTLRVLFICVFAVMISKPIEMQIYRPALQPFLEQVRVDELIEFQSAYAKLGKEQVTDRELEDLTRLIQADSYFTRQLIYLHQAHPEVWLISLLFTIIFLFPVSMRLFDQPIRDYKMVQFTISRRIVSDEYLATLKFFRGVFSTRYGLDFELNSVYEDPPFNTKRKEEPPIPFAHSSDELLDHLYVDRRSGE
ncbi:MAG: DUF4407 domain-containing protein [Chitinophagales bacterium]|nr:DUF4407 domain-containing protein [Saprospiraceae bacterium]MCB9019439.1 DUF4407 domain-containing protein [Chitinophagales bacterium]MCB9312585.1 DUF4407 domain-containing protein [Lewinellaceae bacterium]